MIGVASDIEGDALTHALAARGVRVTPWHQRSGDIRAALLDWAGKEPVNRHLERVRAQGWHGPVMLVSRNCDSAAIAEALDAGAEDAVLADTQPLEIVARVTAMLRRGEAHRLRIGPLEIDRLNACVRRDGKPLDLLPREYRLLLYLAEHSGRTVSRAELLKSIWRLDFDPGTNVVQVHISRLRARLDRTFAAPMLHTVSGKGYRLTPPNAA